MTISKFKNQVLKLIIEVAQSQTGIIITKRGKAITKLVPFIRNDNEKKNQPGNLINTLIEKKQYFIAQKNCGRHASEIFV
jgi:antitoxin (DNA-binding transcriptional repressor) of toxin-antitoxin stability system